MKLKDYQEDEQGWFYYTNKFGEVANPYDLSQVNRSLKGEYRESKTYVKLKKTRFRFKNSLG